MDIKVLPQIISNIPMVNGEVMRLTNNGRILPYIKDAVYCNFGLNFFSTFAEYWMDKDYVSSTEIFHVEENQQNYTIKVGADVQAAGAGLPVSISYGANIVGNYTNVQPGFWVIIPPLGKLGKVVSLNPTAKTFMVEPADKAFRIDLKAGNELIVAPASIVAACGCVDLPSSVKMPGLLYKSNMMIIEKQKTICGEDLAQWLEQRTLFPMRSSSNPCEDVQVWWHADLDLLWEEFTLAKQMFVMFGENITNDSVNFTGLKSTSGVMHMLRSRATQEPVSAAGITDAYFRRLAKRLKRIRGYCNQYGFWMGANHRSQVDIAYEAKVTKQDVSWNFLQGDKERGIRFGFDALKIDGIEYYFHDEGSFNDPGFLGASGFNGPDMTIGIPLCRMQCGNRGVSTPLVINYLAGNGINRELIENDYGVLRPGSHNSKCDWHEWQLKSQFGIDAYCMNQFVFTETI